MLGRRSAAFVLALFGCGGGASSGAQDTDDGTTSSSDGETSSTGGTTGGSTDGSDSATSSGASTGEAACVIHAGPEGVDDATCGDLASPCRTLTQALTVATAGCTIQLAAGDYHEADGEVLPWVLPADVDLQGAGADPDGDHTFLDAQGASNSATHDVVCDADKGPDPLRTALLVQGSRVSDLRIRGGGGSDMVTVLVEGGPTELDGLRVEQGQEGIFVAGTATVTILQTHVSGAAHAAIKPAGDSQVEVIGVTLTASKDGLEPICRAVTTVRESEVFCNGNGLEALDRAETTMIDNLVHHNINGIGARGAMAAIHLRGNQIHDNSFGVVEIFGALDMGTGADPGNNVIRDNRFGGVLLNGVPADTWAVGNTWQPDVDGADAAGLYAGAVAISGPVCGNANAEVEAPVPDPCDPGVPVMVDPGFQNYALNDGSCAESPTCGGNLQPCPVLGSLVLSE